VVAAALLWREWTTPRPESAARFRALGRALVPFLAGAALPIAVFIGSIALAGGLDEFLQGVFVKPFRRLAFATMRPPAPHWILAVAPLAVLLRPRSDAHDPKWRRAGALAGLLLGLVLWLAFTESFVHRLVWQSIRSLGPVLAVVAAAIIAAPSLARGWAPDGRRRFILLAAVSALVSLVQFPFSSPVYFMYVAPLLLLAALALLRSIGDTPPGLVKATLGLYAAFGALVVTPGAVVGLGFRYEPRHETTRLELPRGGLRINPVEAELYPALVQRIDRLAGNGEIWAGPDAPEVYFLSGRRNATRAIFDFLGDGAAGPAPIRPEVRVLVINTRPAFSPPLAPALVAQLRAAFPRGVIMDKFELRWRP
jgi:hypothetical protein